MPGYEFKKKLKCKRENLVLYTNIGFVAKHVLAAKQTVSPNDFDVFCDVSWNKRLNKHLICRWFETT